jgi:heme/copper-type cytochrome/quinol oxidase subunit 1
MFIGMNLVFMPFIVLGLLGMPRRIYTYSPDQGWSSLNLLASVGAFLIAISFLVLLWNFIRTMRRPAQGLADPWDAFTLEWKTSSPPAPYNFKEIPTVGGRRPLWDEKHPEQADWRAGQ